MTVKMAIRFSCATMLWLCLVQVLQPALAYTKSDALRALARGDANVVLGALQGETFLIRRGVAEGGEITAVLNDDLGQLFRFGSAWRDFPKWPALQLAIASGKKKHLNAAFFLLNHGASMTHAKLPFTGVVPAVLPPTGDGNARGGEEETHTEEFRDEGYAPALLYALGFGGVATTHQHAALLQRLHDRCVSLCVCLCVCVSVYVPLCVPASLCLTPTHLLPHCFHCHRQPASALQRQQYRGVSARHRQPPYAAHSGIPLLPGGPACSHGGLRHGRGCVRQLRLHRAARGFLDRRLGGDGRYVFVYVLVYVYVYVYICFFFTPSPSLIHSH